MGWETNEWPPQSAVRIALLCSKPEQQVYLRTLSDQGNPGLAFVPHHQGPPPLPGSRGKSGGGACPYHAMRSAHPVCTSTAYTCLSRDRRGRTPFLKGIGSVSWSGLISRAEDVLVIFLGFFPFSRCRLGRTEMIAYGGTVGSPRYARGLRGHHGAAAGSRSTESTRGRCGD